jgi:hypothetical protein
MLLNKRKGKPCKEQYEGFAKNKKVNNAVLLPFLGVENYDIYNPSIPFEMDGITWMAGRIEPRGGHDSYVRFFEKREDGYYCRYDMPEFKIEDPFVTFTAGIERLPNGTARVYTGLSDSSVGMAIIEDPFIKWENLIV